MMLRFLLIILATALLCACGSSGKSFIGTTHGTGSSGNTAQVQGIWTGSLTVTGSPSTPIFAPIVQNGLAFFFDKDGVIYVMPAFTGGTTIKDATLLAIAPAGVTLPDGQNQESFTATLTVSTKSISGNFSGSGETGTFILTPTAPFAGNPSVVAGNWQGFYLGTGTPAVTLTVQPGGIVVGNDADGCTLSGNISLLQSGQNLFSVSLTSTGSSALCQGKVKGLAFESSSDFAALFGGTTGTYYYITATNTSGGFVAELKVQ